MSVQIVARYQTSCRETIFELSCGCEARLSDVVVLAVTSKSALTDAFAELLEQHVCPGGQPKALAEPPRALGPKESSIG